MVGTVSRGVRAPIIRSGDDLVEIVSNSVLEAAKDEGFDVSIAAMRGGISGPCMQHLIDLGVTEFTLDHHCSMGLSW
jgi:hypothetical protein